MKNETLKNVTFPRQAVWLWLIPLLLIGFWLRLTFLAGNVYYGDEFISMLAAKMVAAQGWPLLPSGLYYDHGLLYSLTGGAFIALLGFSEQIARWPVLWVGVLTIAVYYAVGKRLFASPLTGIIAASLITFDINMMKWGVWARMYALAHLFVLLLLAWLLFSALHRPSRRGRYLTLLFLAGMLFSHSLTFLLLPPLALLLLIFSFTYRRDWLIGRDIWLQALIGGLIVAVALVSIAGGHVGSTVSLQDQEQAALSLPDQLGFLQGFFLITINGDHYQSLFDYFREPVYGWLLYPIGLSLLVSLYRLLRRTATFADVAFLFITLLPLLLIVEMGTLLTDEWRQSRYMYFLTLPAFMLLSAESLSRLLRGLLGLLSRLGGSQPWAGPLRVALPLLVAGPVAILWGGPTWELASVRATGDYDTAYDFVREQWQPGDRIMTEHPAAGYLYMAQVDYYANQTSAKVLDEKRDDGEVAPIDRYTGSPLIDSVEALNAALGAGQRVWLVVGDKHLLRYYDNLFREQIFAQMDVVYQAGTKYVLVNHPHPVPLNAEPLEPLSGNFDNRILLEGYSFDLARMTPDGLAPLGLYWRPIGDPPPRPLKVFVQLRDGSGQTLAQADHFIYDGLFTSGQWLRHQAAGEIVRDSADLRLPQPFIPENGPYRLYIGFYDPDTFERLPVINDSSGENAVVIDFSPHLKPEQVSVGQD